MKDWGGVGRPDYSIFDYVERRPDCWVKDAYIDEGFSECKHRFGKNLFNDRVYVHGSKRYSGSIYVDPDNV